MIIRNRTKFEFKFIWWFWGTVVVPDDIGHREPTTLSFRFYSGEYKEPMFIIERGYTRLMISKYNRKDWSPEFEARFSIRCAAERAKREKRNAVQT